MNGRLKPALLALSASALVGIAVHEGYRGEAYEPVKGDVPTIGFGTTEGVEMGVGPQDCARRSGLNLNI